MTKTILMKAIFACRVLRVLTWTTMTLLLVPAQPAQSQEEIEFINWGVISVSPKFTLGRGGEFIVFPVRNNTTRSISTIYAWIYERLEDDEGVVTFRLANNPNAGGILLKGRLHTPGTVANWRFSLVATGRPVTDSPNYTLRVSHKGVFFSKTEPPASKPKE